MEKVFATWCFRDLKELVESFLSRLALEAQENLACLMQLAVAIFGEKK